MTPQLVRDDQPRFERRHRQEQHELLAADARKEVFGALVTIQDLGNRAQKAIARLVAVLIVDPLEEVDVPDRVCQRLRVPLPTLMLLGDPLLVGVAAVHAGQRIDHQPALLRRADLGELVRSRLELRDLALQIGRVTRALRITALFALAETPEPVRHRV